MKKDGTRYLCFVEFLDGHTDWVVLFWDTPCGLSVLDTSEKTWVFCGGLAPKIKQIIIHYPLKCREI